MDCLLWILEPVPLHTTRYQPDVIKLGTSDIKRVEKGTNINGPLVRGKPL